MKKTPEEIKLNIIEAIQKSGGALICDVDGQWFSVSNDIELNAVNENNIFVLTKSGEQVEIDLNNVNIVQAV